jgi:hypothetical protein
VKHMFLFNVLADMWILSMAGFAHAIVAAKLSLGYRSMAATRSVRIAPSTASTIPTTASTSV